MNLQQLFDDVTRHLLTQNERASAADGKCVYRSEDGLTCAVGALFSADLYDPHMEGHTAEEILSTNASLREHLTNKYNVPIDRVGDYVYRTGEDFDSFLGALDELQRLHDNIQPDQWPVRLKAFAKDYGLDYSHVITETA